MQRTNIYLEDAQIAALDAAARREGRTRAELVRRYVDQGLMAARSDVDRDLAVLKAAFGVLKDEDIDILDRRDGERGVHLQNVWKS